MKSSIVLAFALSVLLQTTNVIADNPEKPKSRRAIYSNVNSEIKDLLDFHDFGQLTANKGNVFVKYYIDQNNTLHINEVGATNTDLKNYVFKTLEARKVTTPNIEINKEQVVKLSFELASN